ncbi:putative Zinc finger, SWIM-type, FHY3/FAR1 family [Helianthus annuus]|nr:putative Zinc finger, SWIM-type, FHY3/FAR1 family [Helianthus annuus]
MWHIMDKLPLKIREDTDLSKRLNKLVRNAYLSVIEFEESWHKLVVDYELSENKWLRDMFEIRERWIPTYFKDIPMCCITKITSRVDTFFKVESHPNNSLVHFIMCFENAMEAQRLNQRQLDHVTNTTTPVWLTPLPIERYAANVYTRTLFTDVQKEIRKCVMSCAQITILSENGCNVHVIEENRSTATTEFKVVRNLGDGTMVCSCLNMVRVGYICRHIFFVLRVLGVHEISDKYVLRRWKRDALPADILKKPRYGSVDDESDALMSKARLLW